MITLRPDQQAFIADLRAAFKRHRSVLGMAATGFGKTYSAAAIVHGAINKGSRIIFAVHRDELMHQTSKAFDAFGIPYGFIVSGVAYDRQPLVHIASIMTLAKRLDTVLPPNLVVIDEAHLSRAKTWHDVVQHYLTAGARILGLSGSPQRLDGKGLGELFSTLVCGPSTAELIAAGHLCRYRYFRGAEPDLTAFGRVAGEYTQAALDSANDSRLVGNIADRWIELASGRRTICFTVSHEHSRSIIEEFAARGVRAASISSKTRKAGERERIIREFADGEIRVLCNVELITTGFDLAAQVGRDVTVDCILMARPTQSLALYLQMVGRGMRAKPYPCIILDHAGNSQRHGYPDDPRDWPLLYGGGKPAALPPPPLDCAKCLCQVRQPPPGECPHCGEPWVSSDVSAARAIEYDEAARLVEVTEAQRLAEQVTKVEMRREEARCRTLEDWKEIEKNRGYKSGWAEHRFGARMNRGKR